MKLVAAKLIATFALIVLTGCSTGYSKPGASYNDFLNDRYQCMKEVAGTRCVDGGLYTSCMMQKGWAEGSDGYQPPQGAAVRVCN